MPEIFMDTSYAVAHHFNLYTSQVWKKKQQQQTKNLTAYY